MKYYTNYLTALIFSVFLSIIFSACSSVTASLEGRDASLPTIANIKTLSDVGAIAFEWERISDERVNGIAIYKEKKSGEKPIFREIAYLANPQTTHFVDENLIPETQYRYKFRTTSPTHYSPDSVIVSAKTSFIDAVESVFASNDYPRQVKLIFSPHPNPSISHYLIQREIDGNFKTIALVNHRLMPEYFDKDLDDGKTYQYRIIAIDHAGNPSRPSKVVVAKTKNPPKIPQNLTATTNLPQKIVLSWSKSADIKQYHIYRAKSENGRFILHSTTKNSKFIDNINANGAIFYYKISGIDGADLQSPLSAAVAGQTKSAPTAPTITQGYVDNKEAIIKWEGDSNAKHFVVFRIDSQNGRQARFKVDKNDFSDKEVSVGGEFSYYVIAVDDNGLESAPSNKVILSIK